jgi:acyl transferase domain-containing protein/phosphopantetheinyl transferase
MPEGPSVAIVGMGAVFPGANDVQSFWQNICNGVDSITEVPPSRWDPGIYYDPGALNGSSAIDRLYCRRGGFVDDQSFDPLAFGMMPSAVAGTEPDQLLALRTASEAIKDAGGAGWLPERHKIGVIIGRGGYLTPGGARMDLRVRTGQQILSVVRELIPGIQPSQLEAVRQALDQGLGSSSPEASFGLVPNFSASRIANRLDFQGPAYIVDAACASSLIAVDHGVRELMSGRCDVVLAGGVHHCHLATLWSVFTQLRALSPSERIRPFDRRADGTLMSEGTGIVVLKRLADAERDGDRIYAVIRGSGIASDGRAASLMSPLAAGQVLAVEQAWREAGLDPTSQGALGLLEAHGTATPVGDQTELETLARVFGELKGAPAGLGTVKSMIGHAMPAAGIAGLIKAALAVYHGIKPPTLNVEEPHPAFSRTRFSPITELALWESELKGPRRAGVNAFGFGGINAHVILEQAPGASLYPPALVRGAPITSPVESAASTPILLMAAESLDELASRLEVDNSSLLAQAQTAPAPAGAGPVRLAIVDPTERTLALARRILARGTPWRGRSDVWFTQEPLLSGPLSGPGKVVFMFPGLEPEFEPTVADVASHFRLSMPQLKRGPSLFERSFDIVAVGRLLFDALREVGINADLMAGHSVGEWTALASSGAYDRGVIDEFVASVSPGALTMPDVGYAALWCGAKAAEEAIGDLEGVTVSHDNCPRQSIICGYQGPVEVVVERLKARGVLCQTLPFRSGFHTPMLAAHIGPFRQATEHLQPSAAHVPVWSATLVAPYPDDPEAIRELTIRHLLEPVRFGPMIDGLYRAGARAFVQIGVGSLPGFVDDTLRDEQYLSVTANLAGRSGMAQLSRVAAALWTEGREVSWQRLRSDPVQAGRVEAQAPSSSGSSVRLDLANPVVHLSRSFPPIAVSEQQPLERHAHPILAELGIALQEAGAAARSVVSAWQQRRGEVSQLAVSEPLLSPPAASSTTFEFSFETFPFVRDHGLIPQRPGWHDDSDRFPVVPLTTLLEVMADHARRLAGGTVVGFSQVRALRWLVVAPPTTATITTRLLGSGRVKVSIEGYSSGVVHLAERYPDAGDPEPLQLISERTPEVTARQLYDDRWMFHGPQFAGISEVSSFAENGIRGVLKQLPAPGALLDNAGQLIGHWMQLGVERDKLVFPVSVDEIRLFGPPPELDEPITCTFRIRSITGTQMQSDATLDRADGSPWGRIDGWTNRRFATDEITWRIRSDPDKLGVGEPQPGGWCLVREHCPDTAVRELMMRRYLCASERVDYERQNLRGQRQWLLGRIAAKDAVRNLLWKRGQTSIFPAELNVTNDAQGRPRVAGPFDVPIHISIAHTMELGVAIASTEGPVGIDLEAVAERSAAVEKIALTGGEQRWLDAQPHRAEGMTRLWTAKEAVAKVLGTGLAGRPQSLEVTVDAGDGLQVVVDDRIFGISSELVVDGDTTYVVAWTGPLSLQDGGTIER